MIKLSLDDEKFQCHGFAHFLYNYTEETLSILFRNLIGDPMNIHHQISSRQIIWCNVFSIPLICY
jgi:hypothetical protein